MGMYKYVTNRTVPNKQGEETGRIRMKVLNDSDQLEGDYHCPECGHDGKVDQAFVRPIKLRCEACNLLIRVPKLKKAK